MIHHHTKLSSLKKEALRSLTGEWGEAVQTTFLYAFLYVLLNILNQIVFVATMIVGPLLVYGYTQYLLRLSRHEKPKTETLFEGFNDRRFGVIFVTSLLMSLKIFLWTLLLIVPGIIAALNYSQTFFILADKKDLSASEAIKESIKIMQGKRWRYFLLALSFIGWQIIGILSFFIGFLWITPYMGVTLAKFYDEIKHS